MSDDVAAAIRRQVEFYFSDVNLAKDVFLKTTMADDVEGFVPLDVLLTFNRLSALTRDAAVLCDALKASDKVVVDEARMAVRRKHPLPESIQTDEQTVYVKPVPPSATLEQLTTFFGQHGTVLAVWRRYFPGSKTAAPEARTKPSVFVVFDSRDAAERFAAAPPAMDGVPLTAQMKTAYLQGKAAEAASRHRVKRADKTADATATTKAKDSEETTTTTAKDGEATTSSSSSSNNNTTPPMPRDSSYRISGCGEIAKFSDVKELWPAEEQKGVRYVFTPQKEVAIVIFQDAETAQRMVDSARTRAATLNGTQPTLEKLSGDDETQLLANVEEEIATRAAQRSSNNHHSGRGGRGGGRGHRGGRGGGRGGAGHKRPRN